MNLKTLIFALAYWGRTFDSFLEDLKTLKSPLKVTDFYLQLKTNEKGSLTN